MGGREARGCGRGAGSPGRIAGLRSVESHCPSLWAQTARDCPPPSVHLLDGTEKNPPSVENTRIQRDALDHGGSHGVNVPDSVALFRQERAALSLAHSSELDPSLRIVSLT